MSNVSQITDHTLPPAGRGNVRTLAAIPCHDEGLAIGSVVLKARKYVDPGAGGATAARSVMGNG